MILESCSLAESYHLFLIFASIVITSTTFISVTFVKIMLIILTNVTKKRYNHDSQDNQFRQNWYIYNRIRCHCSPMTHLVTSNIHGSEPTRARVTPLVDRANRRHWAFIVHHHGCRDSQPINKEWTMFEHVAGDCTCPGKWCPGCGQVKCQGTFY